MSEVPGAQLRGEEARREWADAGAIGTPQLEVRNGHICIRNPYFTLKAEDRGPQVSIKCGRKRMTTSKRAPLYRLVSPGEESHQLSSRGTHNGRRLLASLGPAARRGPNFLGREPKRRKISKNPGERNQHTLESRWMRERKMWRFLDGELLLRAYGEVGLWEEGEIGSVLDRLTYSQFSPGLKKMERDFYSKEDLWLEPNRDM